MDCTSAFRCDRSVPGGGNSESCSGPGEVLSVTSREIFGWFECLDAVADEALCPPIGGYRYGCNSFDTTSTSTSTTPVDGGTTGGAGTRGTTDDNGGREDTTTTTTTEEDGGVTTNDVINNRYFPPCSTFLLPIFTCGDSRQVK